MKLKIYKNFFRIIIKEIDKITFFFHIQIIVLKENNYKKNVTSNKIINLV